MKEKLAELRELYESGENISSYLRGELDLNMNTSETIQAAYDLQAGTYRKRYYDNPDLKNQYCKHLAREIDKLGELDSLLLVGCGEAITLSLLLKYLQKKPKHIFGIDISLSRLLYAEKFSSEQGINGIKFILADLFSLPFLDNSVDLVLTNHSLEPNGGRERQALIELNRVSRKHIMMNEPSFEFGDKEARNRINKHGYVKDLDKEAINLGYNIFKHGKFPISMNPKNPTASTIIIKEHEIPFDKKEFLACPISKKPLILKKEGYYCEESYL